MTTNAAIKLVSEDKTKIQHFARALIKYGASDMHLKADRSPMYRISGKLIVAKTPALSSEQIRELLYEVMDARAIKRFEQDLQADFSFKLPDLGRFRASIYLQQGTVAGAIRVISSIAHDVKALGVPASMTDLVEKKSGLILITGPTGSGKSTTMAALIDHINRTKHSNIITIEDPIEYVFVDRKSTISQREIGSDATSMSEALKGTLRQDPDLIIIGEMRDYETISAALTAAETGHLVISTLHTADAKSSIDRIVDVFPLAAKEQVRVQLSESLVAVLSQKLVQRADKSGRIAVCELMVNSPTIQTLIRKSEFEKIPEAMSNSNTYYNMRTFNQEFERLVDAGIITQEEALSTSNAPDDLRMRLAGFKKEEGY